MGGSDLRWRRAFAGGREWSLMEESDRRWSGVVRSLMEGRVLSRRGRSLVEWSGFRWGGGAGSSGSSEGNNSLVDGSGLRWLGAVAGGWERSLVDGSGRWWMGAGRWWSNTQLQHPHPTPPEPRRPLPPPRPPHLDPRRGVCAFSWLTASRPRSVLTSRFDQHDPF